MNTESDDAKGVAQETPNNAGKRVKVHYVGTLDDGTVFDSSRERDQPIEFTCMKGQMIPGFDRAVSQMAVGETRTVRLEPKDAYGMPDPSKVLRIGFGEHLYFYDENDKPVNTNLKTAQHGKATFVGAKDPSVVYEVEVGGTYKIIARTHGKAELKVVKARNDTVEFDLNHRLAGKALTLEIELLEVEDPS